MVVSPSSRFERNQEEERGARGSPAPRRGQTRQGSRSWVDGGECIMEGGVQASAYSGPGRSLGLKLRDTRVYEPQTRTRLGATAHFKKTRRMRVYREEGGPSGDIGDFPEVVIYHQIYWYTNKKNSFLSIKIAFFGFKTSCVWMKMAFFGLNIFLWILWVDREEGGPSGDVGHFPEVVIYHQIYWYTNKN